MEKKSFFEAVVTIPLKIAKTAMVDMPKELIENTWGYTKKAESEGVKVSKFENVMSKAAAVVSVPVVTAGCLLTAPVIASGVAIGNTASMILGGDIIQNGKIMD